MRGLRGDDQALAVERTRGVAGRVPCGEDQVRRDKTRERKFEVGVIDVDRLAGG